MSNKPQSENGGAGKGAGNADDLQRRLVRRVAFAGLLIALLLGALAFIDYLGQPGEEPAPTGPSYTTPVPVPKKEVTQPVKPAEPTPPEPAPEAAKEPLPPLAPEAPTAAPPAQPAPPSPTTAAPARPEVAAQPALPKPEARVPVPAPARPVRPQPTPAEGTAAATTQFTPEPEKVPAQPEPRTPPAERQPPAQAPAPQPPRLFSGYAVQAGVFADAQHAEELRAKLALNGIPATIEARVQVGPFKTREEAEAARQKLKMLGIEGLLLPPAKAGRRP